MAEPRYREIADQMRELIVSGHWPPGTLVPVSDELLARFATSSATLARAVSILRDEGLVSRAAQHGRLVVMPRPQPIHLDLDDDPDAWQRACERAGLKGALVKYMTLEISPRPDVAGPLQLPAHSRVIETTYHGRIGDALLVIMKRYDPDKPARPGPVAEVVEDLFTRPATGSEIRSLELRPGSVVLAVERIGRAQDGLPVGLVRIAAHPQRVRIRRRSPYSNC